MKKYKSIVIFFIVILILFLIVIFIYNVFGKSKEDKKEEKSLAEISYIEDKFVNLFNELNSISFENYKITSNNIENKNNKKEYSENNSENKKTNEDSQREDTKQYNLEETGILIQEKKIDWKQIKIDVENIYSKIYSLTLNLYSTSIKKEDIIDFNKEFDNLTVAVKNENKDQTLIELSKLYNYVSKFYDEFSKDESNKIAIKTKNNIFQAYSILDSQDWQKISEYIDKAIQEFMSLVTDPSNMERKNQYTINKIYVMLNELKNAINIKDIDIFLIKYKNVLEELQNI